MTVIDRSLTRLLKQRRLFLTRERSDAAEIVYVCVDDGLPGGYPVGYVIPSRTGTWFAYARARPGRVFANDQVDAGLLSVEEAVRAVLDHARYGDVLFALEQRAYPKPRSPPRCTGPTPPGSPRSPSPKASLTSATAGSASPAPPSRTCAASRNASAATWTTRTGSTWAGSRTG